MKIAWIGTGVMGNSMAGHLIDAGHQLFVFNRTTSKTENLIKKGATLLEKIEDAPLVADIIFTMVGYPVDVENVYNQLYTNAKKDQIMIDMTTSSPQLAKDIYQKFSMKGCHVFDIPVTGGDIGAKNKTLTVFVGGEEELYLNNVKPLLEIFATKIEYFGESGNGQLAKLANQVAIASTMISVAESIIFALKTGLNVNKFMQTISSGSAASFSLTSYGPRILNDDFMPGFYIHHFIKDMALALKECQRYDFKLPGLELAYNLYNQLSEEIKNLEGTQSIIKAYR